MLAQAHTSQVKWVESSDGTASNTSISSLLTNSSTVPFPPPLACYPGLLQSQIQLITNVGMVFNDCPRSVSFEGRVTREDST